MVLALKRWSMRRAVRLSRLKLGLDQPSILGQQGAFGVTNPPSGMTQPGKVLICNDGAAYVASEGPVRATRVLDTLHAKAIL